MTTPTPLFSPLLVSAVVLATIGTTGWSTLGCIRPPLWGAGAQGSPTDADVSDATPVDGPTSQEPIDGACPDGFTACGGGTAVRCYDLTRASDHCGACGNACAPGIACRSSKCQQHRCKGSLSFKALPAVCPDCLGDYVPVLGDFDRDGRLDLVGPTGPSTGMGLWRGLGDGAFEPLPIGPADTRPWKAAAADLNGDGWLDLASVAVGDSKVSVRLGNGDPTSRFAEPTTYRTPSPVLALLLADLDSDGHVDLVTAADKRLTVWRGTASGTLAEPVDVSVGAAGSFLVAADWSQDGIPDLLYGASTLRMMMGRGDGTFDPELACGVGLLADIDRSTRGTVLADFDHDRKVDMVATSRSVLLGMNGCNFTTLVSLPAYFVTATGSVGVGDLDGDSNADIVSSFFLDGQPLAVVLGDGRGKFTAPALLSSTAAYYNGNYMSGDLNNDGKLDVVVTQWGGFQAFLNTCP